MSSGCSRSFHDGYLTLRAVFTGSSLSSSFLIFFLNSCSHRCRYPPTERMFVSVIRLRGSYGLLFVACLSALERTATPLPRCQAPCFVKPSSFFFFKKLDDGGDVASRNGARLSLKKYSPTQLFEELKLLQRKTKKMHTQPSIEPEAAFAAQCKPDHQGSPSEKGEVESF